MGGLESAFNRGQPEIGRLRSKRLGKGPMFPTGKTQGRFSNPHCFFSNH